MFNVFRRFSYFQSKFYIPGKLVIKNMYCSKNGVISSTLIFFERISPLHLLHIPALNHSCSWSLSVCVTFSVSPPLKTNCSKNPPNGLSAQQGKRTQPSLSYWARINATNLHLQEKYTRGKKGKGTSREEKNKPQICDIYMKIIELPK